MNLKNLFKSLRWEKKFYLIWIYDKFSYISNRNEKIDSHNFLKKAYPRISELFKKRSDIIYSTSPCTKNMALEQDMYIRLRRFETYLKYFFNEIDLPEYLLIYSDKNIFYEYFSNVPIDIQFLKSELSDCELEVYFNNLTNTKIEKILTFMYTAKYFYDENLLIDFLKDSDGKQIETDIKLNVIDFLEYKSIKEIVKKKIIN